MKAQVLAECDAAGASVAKVAMAHGINANIVHRWRKLAREHAGAAIGKSLEFVHVAMATTREQDVEIEGQSKGWLACPEWCFEIEKRMSHDAAPVRFGH